MENILTIRNVTKYYKNQKVLDNVNMNINRGDIYGFVGQNGAGKTTIIRIITGLIYASSGDFSLFGVESSDKEILNARKKMGAIVESPSIYKNLSAKENLIAQANIIGLKDYSKIKEVLTYVGLEELYDNSKKAGNFSLGMRQRLGIAMALLGDPELLILDEPMNGLDPEGIVEIRNLILKLNQEKNITFIISSHILSELSLIAKKYGIISKGRLIKEIDSDALKKECSRYVKILTNNKEESIKALLTIYSATDIKYSSDYVLVYGEKSINEIISTLTNANIDVLSFNTVDFSIEDYYLSLVGGGKHA